MMATSANYEKMPDDGERCDQHQTHDRYAARPPADRKRSGELVFRVALVREITNEDLLCSFLNGTRPLQAIIDYRRLKVGWG
jgi:hypothetical protein